MVRHNLSESVFGLFEYRGYSWDSLLGGKASELNRQHLTDRQL